MSTVRIALLPLLALGLAACSSTRVSDPTAGGGELVPRKEPPSATGNPDSYVALGQRYFIARSSEGYKERGAASWYGPDFHGKKTSSGTPYNMHGISAAHKSLPIPTYVRVTNLENGRSLVVRVDDRGPFKDGRIIDLSYGAAQKLGVIGKGTAPVEVEALPPYQYLPGSGPGETYFASLERMRGRGYAGNERLAERAAPLPPAAPLLARRDAPAALPLPAQPSAQPAPLPTPAARPAPTPVLASRTEPLTVPPLTLTAAAGAGTSPAQPLPAQPLTPVAAAQPPGPMALPMTPRLALASSQPLSIAPVADASLYLQVAAFNQRQNAEQLRQQLSHQLGRNSSIASAGNLHRVRIGPLHDRDEVERLALRLASLGYSRPHLVVE
ncbi:MAG TPA: septal ring lytic transglycosylase RlpA family protein [Candidatus Competibacteraceae bacterium]|nr:septal ring lytic transglycosylase RlpA family protein [Candidatus Competibacteraceae bacterium]